MSVNISSNHKLEAKTLEGRLRHFDTLVQEINTAVEASTQAKVEEVIRVLMELHGAGLERMLDLIWESGPQGQAIIQDLLAQDDLVSSLLLVHGLHPLSLETRVSQALEKVRPYMHSHGGDVELLDVTTEGVVRLRLDGTCHDCPSSRITLKFAVEKAIYEAAPDALSIEVAGGGENQPTVNPYTEMPGPNGQNASTLNGRGWIEVQGLATLQAQAVRVLQVASISILFCRVDQTYYAYGSACPKCSELLGRAKLAGKDLTCARCGHRFDILRAGRDLDEPALHLEPFPLLEEHGRIQVALPSS